jgi:hypothetical protein
MSPATVHAPPPPPHAPSAPAPHQPAGPTQQPTGPTQLAAAVLVNATQSQRHIIGDLAVRFFQFAASATSITLNTGMLGILYVDIQLGTAITAFSISGSTITFTTSGNSNLETVMVIAREG